MSVIINEMDGSSKIKDDVHYLTLNDGKMIIYGYDFKTENLWWGDLYIVDGKYYKTDVSTISDPKEFMRLLRTNITRSKPFSGVVQEVSSNVISEIINSDNVMTVSPTPNNPPVYGVSSPPPKNPPVYGVSSPPPKPPKYRSNVVSNPSVEVVDNADKVIYLPTIAIPIEKNGEMFLNFYTRQHEEECQEIYIGEEYGRFKHYFDVHQVGSIKLVDKNIDDLVWDILSPDKSGLSLKFENTSNKKNTEYFVIEDLLLNYSSQTHRCEDKKIVIRDFIADDYISNCKGQENYKRYSNDSRSNFVGLKRTVFHRNLYEINRDYNDNQGRSR